MSYNQVKYYQDLEDYDAAYRIARADWDVNPKLLWPKKTIGWLLIKMMKANANAYAQKKFFAELQEFGSLGIPPSDKKLWGAVAWPIRDIVADSMKMQWFTPQFGDSLFESIFGLPFDKPSESYSAMAKAFVALGALWPRLADFIEWWGFENFNVYDYRRYPENGRLESMAEKVMTAYITARQGHEPPEAFFNGLNAMAMHSQEQADRINKIIKYNASTI